MQQILTERPNDVPQTPLSCTLRQERSRFRHLQTLGNPAGFHITSGFFVKGRHSVESAGGGKISTLLLTLTCQRERTATTIAVVVLPLPLEQLKTKAE